MYKAKLAELGVNASRVNTTRLKDRILSTLPHVSAQTQGRDILILDQDVGEAIKLANDQDTDAEAMHLARAAKIVRKDIFKQNQSFQGTFQNDYQESSVPPSLKALVNFILKGSCNHENTVTKDAEEASETQAVLSILQLIVYNTSKRPRERNSSSNICRTKNTWPYTRTRFN